MTIKKILCIIALFSICIICSNNIIAQDLSHERREIRLSNNDTTEVFFILNRTTHLKYHNSKRYYWFSASEIKSNMGASSGYLLDGYYEKGDSELNLIEKGEYAKGLRIGFWKCWNSKGNLVSVREYQNGLLHGDYIIYSSSGDITSKDKYRNGSRVQRAITKKISAKKNRKEKEDKDESMEVTEELND